MCAKSTTVPSELLSRYESLIDQLPEVERKGKANPYTSANGYMFSFLTKEGTMGLRLSKEQQEVFLQRFNTELMVQHGRVMKDFVVVTTELLDDTEEMINYLKMSFEHTMSLKPKPTKRK